MKKKENRTVLYKFFFVGGVILFLGVLALSISLPKKISVTHNLKSDVFIGGISEERNFGQTFVAELDNLFCIEVKVAVSNKNREENLFFYLRSDIGSERDIFKFQEKASNIPSDEFFRFEFPEIKHSKGKKYFFFIEIPESIPENALTSWSSAEDQYEKGEKIIHGERLPGDLVFKTEYRQGIMLSGGILIQRLRIIGRFFANLLQNKVFYFILFFLVFIWGTITVIHKKEILQKKYGFWSVWIFILLAVLLGLIILFSGKIVVYNQVRNTLPAGEIYGKETIGQTFIANYENLWAVDILMATHRRKVAGEILFYLKRSVETPYSLAQQKVNAERIKDNRFFRYKFPKLEYSKGEKYYFYLEAPGAKPGNALTVWAHHKNRYDEGEKVVDGEKAEGDLVFRTVYNIGLNNKLKLFLHEITRAKPFPLNRSWFYLGFIGLFLLSSAFFLTYLMKIINEL